MRYDTILLIDDNKSELRLMQEAYKQTGFLYPLKEFSDAKEALEYITKNSKKLFAIICDISMPGMNGTDLLKALNKDHSLKMEAIPFIFMSNSNAERDIEEAYSLSAQGYFQKPMNLEETEDLFKAIINYWSRSQIPRKQHYGVI
jgi:CheY-like chemotaxis protein